MVVKIQTIFFVDAYSGQYFEKQERKTKGLILRFSAILLILQGYALMALQMVVNTLGFGIVKQQN